jgi:hypothetical protein
LSATTRRLPGIRFEAQAPPATDELARMDVAAFVGFASSGPLDIPVPVEDAAQFADVFGADAPLAWNTARGEQLTAYLGPAVRAFFRNGGRRCWVVRVADRKRAALDRFPVSGLAQVDSHGALAPAVLAARSVGSWADGMRVSSRVESTPIRLVERAPLAYDALVGPQDALVPGDLVRVTYAGRPWTLLWTVASVAPGSSSAAPALDDGVRMQRLDVRGEHPYWVRTAEMTLGQTGHLHFLGARGENRVAAASIESVAASGLVRFALHSAGGRPFPVSSAPLRGALVRTVFGSRSLWLDVADVEAGKDGGATVVGTPIQVRTTKPAMHLVQTPGALSERLTLTLRTEDETRGVNELNGLGFAPLHPRFVGDLPSDDDLYGDADLPPDPERLRVKPVKPRFPPDSGRLRADAAQPRFPLAALVGPAAFVPLGASILASEALPAVRPPGAARLRDGLKRFDQSLFLDPQLASSSSTVLMDDADFIRYRRPDPRGLRGMHALLSVDEPTIAAVPDAIHVGWYRAGAGATPAAPAPAPPPTLDWSSFLDCTAHIPSTPTLSRLAGDPPGVVTLTWTATDAKHALYELQEDADKSFEGAETIWSGTAREYAVYARPERSALYFRVRAVAAGTPGGWSNAIVARTPGGRDWMVDDTAAYSSAGLVSLHAALLRMCAGRGDLFAVLALPEHFRERAAAAYPNALRSAMNEPDSVHSRGALYHPWLYSSDPSDPTTIRRVPPDGAAAGEIAARTLERGPWVAPANRPLRDVVALDPPLGPDTYQLLQDAQVNLVRQDPGGFLTLSADTLSLDESLRPIGVRRMLDTLRRTALLYGTRYAFEPNGDILRRTVRRSFQGLLTRMFQLGAFAGATPGDSFQVSVGSPPNTDVSLELGRLIVELRVAPSRPLTFLTVRLTRTGAGALEVESR